ncbi:MAG: DUF4276 family protein [Treponema sp.]|jgi:hypothetical protein|nr:DUF4276 family protein [Treponema sp.]
MIAVLLCCEGPDDQGRKKYIDGEYIQSDGVMQILIKKTSGRNDLNFVVKQRRDLKAISIRKKYLNKQQMTSLRLVWLAQKEKCTHIAYHRDEDNKGLGEMYDQVKGYFKDAEANKTSCLAIVPQHMTESWLLSDKNAFKQVFGEIPAKPVLPSKPEETWGNKGTDNHPKRYLERVLAQYHTTVSSEIYAEIAGNSDIDVLRERCRESFDKKFYTDMQSFITTETAP